MWGTLLPRWEFWGCFPPCVAPVTPLHLPGRPLYPHQLVISFFSTVWGSLEQILEKYVRAKILVAVCPQPSMRVLQSNRWKKEAWQGFWKKLRSHFINRSDSVAFSWLLRLRWFWFAQRLLNQFQSDIPEYKVLIKRLRPSQLSASFTKQNFSFHHEKCKLALLQFYSENFIELNCGFVWFRVVLRWCHLVTSFGIFFWFSLVWSWSFGFHGLTIGEVVMSKRETGWVN